MNRLSSLEAQFKKHFNYTMNQVIYQVAQGRTNCPLSMKDVLNHATKNDFFFSNVQSIWDKFKGALVQTPEGHVSCIASYFDKIFSPIFEQKFKIEAFFFFCQKLGNRMFGQHLKYSRGTMYQASEVLGFLTSLWIFKSISSMFSYLTFERF